MSAIEYYKRFWAGDVAGQRDFPIVDVMGLKGTVIRVPCAGVRNISSIDDEGGHKVKVLATRYTNGNPHAMCQWIDLKEDEVVLGWRTDQASSAPGQWVVFLISDKEGKLIIIPRSSKPPVQKLAVVR
ncbi:hypothetical protein [Cellvibrio sp. UBA7671]|uniref:hypothetical protein n=1 Tax=Cellvibrio sp. UBA7671 TaxID=1946312 RepID=UPI002F359F2E